MEYEFDQDYKKQFLIDNSTQTQESIEQIDECLINLMFKAQWNLVMTRGE